MQLENMLAMGTITTSDHATISLKLGNESLGRRLRCSGKAGPCFTDKFFIFSSFFSFSTLSVKLFSRALNQLSGKTEHVVT